MLVLAEMCWAEALMKSCIAWAAAFVFAVMLLYRAVTKD